MGTAAAGTAGSVLTEGAFIRQVCTGLTDAAEAGHPRFDTATADRLHDDGLDDNAVENLARLLAEQRKATGVVPDDRRMVIERCPDDEGTGGSSSIPDMAVACMSHGRWQSPRVSSSVMDSTARHTPPMTASS